MKINPAFSKFFESVILPQIPFGGCDPDYEDPDQADDDMVDPKFELVSTKLKTLADQLDACPRVGAEKDEPEGSRYIHMSDTLARQIAAVLRGEKLEETPCCMLCGMPAMIADPPAAYICEACKPK